MPGFLISKYKKVPKLMNYDEKRCVSGEFSTCGWNIQWNVLNKFTDDNCFSENEDYIIVFEGMVLNKTSLLKEYKFDNWTLLLFHLAKNESIFWEKFRGVFSGAVYDKRNKSWVVFTDQLGNHLVLYYKKDNQVVFSSQLNYVTDWMRQNKIERYISEKWINDFLCYGYMRDTHTIISECNRIFPGDYIMYDENSHVLLEKQYYRVKKVNCDLDENQIIDKLDSVFKEAVGKVVSKCVENGYKAIVDISGGLDSRMIVAAIKDLGYEDKVLGMNYAQDGSSDQIVSKEVSRKFNIEMLQFLMDDGKCMMDIDDLIFMNQGFNYYIGITGGKFVLENLDRESYGAELWGILGDIYEGAMITETDLSLLKWNYQRFRTSDFFQIDNSIMYDREYQDNEIMWFYIRGMLCGENTAFIRQNYIEAPAVYGDIDFMNFIFSIPYEMRTKGHIYRKWMKKYYPNAYNIIYSDNKVKVCVSDKEEQLRCFPYKVINRMRRVFDRNNYERTISMNPIDYWVKNNESLRWFIDSYFENNIVNLDQYKDLKDKIVMLYSTDNIWNKIIAVSMVSAIKQYIV